MLNSRVLIEKINHVEDHPSADRLSLIQIRDNKCVSAKVNGEHRYAVGDLIIYCPEGAVIPDWLLSKGFTKNGVGLLGGPNGNVVEEVAIRKHPSRGIIFATKLFEGFDPEVHFVLEHSFPDFTIVEGADVTELLGIKFQS